MPSLFRGVIVADSPVGVRVVSVDESSQAYQADLRPEDIIIRIHEQEVQTINDFATLSREFKGQLVSGTVVVFRNGKPREIFVHLYSYPLREFWGIEFVPDYGVIFAEAHVGLAYWSRMGRGYLEARRPAESLDAYLNALHTAPADITVAVKVSELFWEVGRERIEHDQFAKGIEAFERAITILQRLFDRPLTEAQLLSVKEQVRLTLAVLRDFRTSHRERATNS